MARIGSWLLPGKIIPPRTISPAEALLRAHFFSMQKSLLIGILMAFVACKQDDKSPLLYGKWQGASWTVSGQESGRDAAAVQFEFVADGSYSAVYGGQQEKGSFRLSGDKLYTTGENKIEKMVRLSKIAADTLVMDMNRVGTAEVLVLVKK